MGQYAVIGNFLSISAQCTRTTFGHYYYDRILVILTVIKTVPNAPLLPALDWRLVYASTKAVSKGPKVLPVQLVILIHMVSVLREVNISNLSCFWQQLSLSDKKRIDTINFDFLDFNTDSTGIYYSRLVCLFRRHFSTKTPTFHFRLYKGSKAITGEVISSSACRPEKGQIRAQQCERNPRVRKFTI